MKIILYTCFFYLVFHTTNAEPLRGTRVAPVANENLQFVVSFIKIASGEHVCTGALITKSHVLTAAHCLKNYRPKNYVARFRKAEVGDRAFAAFETYDNWALASCDTTQSAYKGANDIGIALLAVPIDKKMIEPVELMYSAVTNQYNLPLEVLGWREVRSKNQLHTVSLNLLTNKECDKKLEEATGNSNKKFPPIWMCTHDDPSAVMEGGDSGAPVIDSNGYVVAVNYGECPRQFADCVPSELRDKVTTNVHTRIQFYKDFIEKATISAYH